MISKSLKTDVIVSDLPKQSLKTYHSALSILQLNTEKCPLKPVPCLRFNQLSNRWENTSFVEIPSN